MGNTSSYSANVINQQISASIFKQIENCVSTGTINQLIDLNSCGNIKVQSLNEEAVQKAKTTCSFQTTDINTIISNTTQDLQAYLQQSSGFLPNIVDIDSSQIGINIHTILVNVITQQFIANSINAAAANQVIMLGATNPIICVGAGFNNNKIVSPYNTINSTNDNNTYDSTAKTTTGAASAFYNGAISMPIPQNGLQFITPSNWINSPYYKYFIPSNDNNFINAASNCDNCNNGDCTSSCSSINNYFNNMRYFSKGGQIPVSGNTQLPICTRISNCANGTGTQNIYAKAIYNVDFQTMYMYTMLNDETMNTMSSQISNLVSAQIFQQRLPFYLMMSVVIILVIIAVSYYAYKKYKNKKYHDNKPVYTTQQFEEVLKS